MPPQLPSSLNPTNTNNIQFSTAIQPIRVSGCNNNNKNHQPTISTISTTDTHSDPFSSTSSSSLLPFPAHINPKQFKPLGISKLKVHANRENTNVVQDASTTVHLNTTASKTPNHRTMMIHNSHPVTITSPILSSTSAESLLRAVSSSLSVNNNNNRRGVETFKRMHSMPMHHLTRSFNVQCNIQSSSSSSLLWSCRTRCSSVHAKSDHDDDSIENNPNCSPSFNSSHSDQDMQISEEKSTTTTTTTPMTPMTQSYETLVNQALRPLHEYEFVITSIARRRILIEFVNSELTREAETFQREFLIRAQVDAE
ncbi:hypothetical protein C9374_002247 [Naegleria lovaniensis]|uniref:Uncharacterized protein n=1 Tax=Naegleria lovaniensis TaxID=51637 RepID=A0AA88GV16_NAELO|nr:uncharacterized protein C9374_002247 [Naegleria lovaniensis]KAG2386503.1 hypothetical protein C9374_002247 [Naegleria lovaniensis]